MSNKIYISLRIEQALEKDFTPIGKMLNAVYINYDGISSFIGYADTKEEVLNLIAPENLKFTLVNMLSYVELETIFSELLDAASYYFYNEEFTYTPNFEED